MIDTHSHIYSELFDEDRAEVIARAEESGVEIQLLPGIDSLSHDALFECCRRWSSCLPMIGLHPTSVNDNPQWEQELQIVEQYLENKPEGIERIYGVGEIGLDLYWSSDSVEQQKESLRRQIELALKYDLPMSIHTREAGEQMEGIIAEFAGRGLRGIFHAFNDSVERYARLRTYGDFLFSIGGVVTFKKSSLPQVVEQINLNELVVETDCPYLTPAPNRGKRNEPSYVMHTAAKVAQIKGISVEQLDQITTANVKRIFRLK